ncbi:MAG: hypothetical protein ACTSRP_00025 [Candidatus Helarchaeota archaeon]
MTLSKSIGFYCLILLIIADYITLSYGAVQDHILINENDVFIWKVNMNKDGLEAFEYDFSIPEEYEFNKDLKGIKIEITKIGGEIKDNETKYSEITIKYYENEQKEEANWELNNNKSKTNIYSYKKEIYASGEFLLKLIYGAIKFIPDDVNWNEIKEEANKNLAVDITLKDYKIEALDAGLELMLHYEDKNPLSLTIKYSELGVMSFYRLEYNDKEVMECTLEEEIIPLELIIGILIFILATIIGVYVFIIRPRRLIE